MFPRDANDVSALVRYVRDAKRGGAAISLTPRSAGTDMTGGPLTDSISLVFTRHMNHTSVADDAVTAEPGAYYRDVEKKTLRATGKLIASYPASRELCAIGGMVANNAGGELTLRYGKTDAYVRALDVVLSDGTRVNMRPLSFSELEEKMHSQEFEGEVYAKLYRLLDENRSVIEAARPSVTKNSAGYALWSVIDYAKRTFDITKLITGSQGTLAIITSATLELVRPKQHKAMLVVMLSDIEILPEIVRRVLLVGPESFESYDDHTFKLGVRFLPQILKQLGPWGMLQMGISFIPEMLMVLRGGVPKLILMAEFAEDSRDEAVEKARHARAALEGLAVRTKLAKSAAGAKKSTVL